MNPQTAQGSVLKCQVGVRRVGIKGVKGDTVVRNRHQQTLSRRFDPHPDLMLFVVLVGVRNDIVQQLIERRW